MSDDLKRWLDDRYHRNLVVRVVSAKTRLRFATDNKSPWLVHSDDPLFLHATARIQQLEAENKALRERVDERETQGMIQAGEAIEENLRDMDMDEAAAEARRLTDDWRPAPQADSDYRPQNYYIPLDTAEAHGALYGPDYTAAPQEQEDE